MNNQLTDCTLVVEGQFVQAHRLVLATCRCVCVIYSTFAMAGQHVVNDNANPCTSQFEKLTCLMTTV